MRAVKKFYRDERGVAVVMIGAIIALLLVFSVMAIDAPQMMLVRTQLQNAADAGALAAALAVGMDPTGDTAAADPAAILAAGANDALLDVGGDNEMAEVVITGSDVYWTGDTVWVRTHRTEADGDPFMNYFLGIFEPSRAGEMQAWAAASFDWVCAGKCIEPWCPPDRWFDANGNDLFDPDSVTNPNEYYDPITTGYTNADLGTEINLILANGNDEGFGQYWYYSICLPPVNKGNPVTGGDQYRDWMCEGCLDSSFTVEPGDTCVVEPGKKVGENNQGLQCLIDMDPLAEWDEVNGTVVNSAYPVSPRIVKAAFFNPIVGVTDDGNGRKRMEIVKIFVLFVADQQGCNSGGSQICGRFMRLNEPGGEICADQSQPTFLFTTRLVQ